MLIGYARVSREDQSLDLQLDALKEAGVEKIFQDVVSGGKVDRVGLEQALEFIRPGDVLVVWKLDRLGRNLKHLIDTVEALGKREIGFKSLREAIDLSTPAGRLYFHVFSALAEFERDMIRERTIAGLAAARARGRVGGGQTKVTPLKTRTALAMLMDSSNSISDICTAIGLSRATFYRHIYPKWKAQQSKKIAVLQKEYLTGQSKDEG